MTTTNIVLAIFGVVLGYYSGVSFRGLSLKMLFGIFSIYLMWSFYAQKIGTVLIIAFVVGFIYSLGNIFRVVLDWVDYYKLSFQLYKARKNATQKPQNFYSEDEESLRAQAEELKRQRQQAEEDIERKMHEAEAEIERAREQFRREKENFEKENKKPEWGAGLNPKKYVDACKILGVPEGASLDECKKAYRHLSSLLHPDKFARYQGSIKEQAVENLKLVNVAWETVQRKFNS